MCADAHFNFFCVLVLFTGVLGSRDFSVKVGQLNTHTHIICHRSTESELKTLSPLPLFCSTLPFFLFLPVSSYKLPFFHLPFSPGFSLFLSRVRENPKLLFVKETSTEESNSSFSLKQQQQKKPQKKIGTW